MDTAVRENTSCEDMVSIYGMGKDIQTARKALGWSRQIAAAYLGISEQSLCRWENGSTKKIQAENYKKLEKILDGTAKLDDNE